MNWRHLLAGCILAAFLLVNAGAPPIPVVSGLVAAVAFTLFKGRKQTRAILKKLPGDR